MPREIDLEVNMPESVELETEVSMPGDIEVGVTLDMNDSVSAKVAEAWAVGERGGVPVSSGDETYHNNAKYYAEKIGFLAVGATGLDAGSDPTATVTTDTDPVSGKDRYNIAFGIPKGDTGSVPNVTVGTVTTGAAGSSASVTRRSGSPDTAPVFDITIPRGDKGDAFHIVKTYASIAAMNADYSGTDVKIGEYVMIVSNVDDPDNAKVYIKGDQAYGFVVDMSGSAGIQGQQAYVWIKYAAAEPTQDSDMKSEPDAWMGIYSGTASSAPTAYTSYTWYEIKGAAGSDGNDGTSAYVHIKWSATEPTQDSDMKSTADAWIGIYSGSSATAPTSYTSYTWYQYKGAAGSPGANAYVHIRYAASEPTQDSDMKTTPDAWIGIYSGTSSTAPTTYTSYAWYQFKGTAGSPGTPGTSAYVHIKYAANEPTQDSDMKNTADAWMGIYAGTSSTAPTSYTSYTWYKIKGETGSAANVYGNTIEMSSSDSTTVATAIADKISKPITAGTSGQVLTSDGQGGQSWQTPSGGTVTDVQEDGTSILNNGVANILTMTGAGSGSAGTKGLVPAPSAGDQGKVFMGSGQWSADIPNRLDALENVYTDTDVTIGTSDWTLSNGVYSYTWQSNLVTANVGVQVFLRDGAENSGIEFYEPTKVTGGVQFDTTDTPSGNFPVTIRLINTKSSQLVSLSADEVSSEAITGCDTVEEALVGLNSNIASILTTPTDTYNCTASGTSGTFYKFGNIIIFNFNVTSSFADWATFGITLPNGFRPSSELTFSLTNNDSVKSNLIIQTGGMLQTRFAITNGTKANGVYVVA